MTNIVAFFGHNLVSDPGFPREGRQLPIGGANLLFCKFFAENCMKMSEFGPRGGVRLWDPLELPL